MRETYAMCWVAGYSCCGTEYLMQRHLTHEERTKLDIKNGIDDPVMEFATKAGAERHLRWNTEVMPGRFVRIMTYTTPDPKNAMELCRIKDAHGQPIKMKDFTGDTYYEIAVPPFHPLPVR